MKWLHSVHTGKNRSTHSGARGLAWPILGGWGPSDPSSNLGGPTPKPKVFQFFLSNRYKPTPSPNNPWHYQQAAVPQQPAMPIQQPTPAQPQAMAVTTSVSTGNYKWLAQGQLWVLLTPTHF